MGKIASVIFICILLPLLQCQNPQANAPLLVLVTIPPYAFLVEEIAKDTVEVRTLLPPGGNPHTFEPTFSQTKDLERAQLWISLGEPSEEKVSHALKSHNSRLKICNLTEGMPLLSSEGHGHHEGQDRHIWLSPKLLKEQACTIKEALAQINPSFEAFYESNLQHLYAEIEQLDQKIGSSLTPLKGEALLVSHPAFGYFCHDYNLEQLAVESEGKDPRPQELSKLLQKTQTLHVRCVLLQAQYNNKGAELIGEKLHLPIYTFDPYAREVLNNLDHLARLIAHE